MNRNSLFVLLVLGVLVPAAFGIKCYVCNSVVDKEGCGHGKEGKDPKFLKDCSDPSQNPDSVHGAKFDICRKIVTMIEFNVNNNTAQERIIRKCGYLESKYDNDCYYRGGFGGRQRTCSCKEDACNSAFTTTAATGPTLLLASVGVIYTITKMY